MASEAMDFQIGDILQGIIDGGQTDYYRFTLNSRQRIVIRGLCPDDGNGGDDEIFIFDEEGTYLAEVYGYFGSFWKYNAVPSIPSPLNIPQVPTTLLFNYLLR